MIKKIKYFVEIKSIISMIRLLKLYLKKKINVSRGMNRGLDPPAPLCNEFPFFLDIDLCTPSLNFN